MAPMLETVPTAAVQPEPMLPELFRVQRLRQDSHDTFAIELVPLNPAFPMAFVPGQFVMAWVMGVGEAPFTLSHDPAETGHWELSTRVVGNVTRALRQLKEGDIVGLRGPLGTGWPLEQAVGRDVVLVAGGVGMSQLWPALCVLMRKRKNYERVSLVYGARTPEDLLYYTQLRQWKEAGLLELYCTVDRATRAWKGHVGVLSTLIPRLPCDSASALAMVCGPEVMTRFALYELGARGLAPEQIYIYMQRNMQCGIGLCGHCQLGPFFVCTHGPVFRYDRVQSLLTKPEV